MVRKSQQEVEQLIYDFDYNSMPKSSEIHKVDIFKDDHRLDRDNGGDVTFVGG